MQIEPFFVEQWMNAHETTATWNIAETCVHSLTFDELLELSGDADGVVRRLKETWLGYGDIVGSPRLRAAIAALYGERIGPDDVLTANGAIGANFLALYALVEPGTTVVSVQPTYQQLFSVPQSLGAEVRALRLREEDGYLPDVDALRALTDERTRLIVLNNPNNPTGALIDEPLLREIVEVARERDAWLFCDEVYRMLEHEPGSTAPSVADLYEKGVSSGSMSKSYSLAGLRTGLGRRAAGGDPALPRRARLHDDQRRRARRRPRRRGARARRRGARAQPGRSCAATSRSSTSGSRGSRGCATCARAPAPSRSSATTTTCPRWTSARACSTSTAPSSCRASPSARSTRSASATRAPATCSRAGWRPCRTYLRTLEG